MNSEHGIVGEAWSAFREAWFSQYANKLIVIDYENLASNPAAVLRRLYSELGEANFQHDFENLSFDKPEYDADLGMPGLHKVRSQVTCERREPCIPPDIFVKRADLAFWKKPEARRKRVVIL